MGISFRYKSPEAPAKETESSNEEFAKDSEYLTSKEDLELDLSDLDGYLEDSSFETPAAPTVQTATVETLKNSTLESPDAPHPSEVKSAAAFMKLADFIKSELKNVIPESPEEAKTQKVISLYERRLAKTQGKQKGLQLKKVA